MSENDRQDEFICGRNAVLAFVEQESPVIKIYLAQTVRSDKRLERIRDLARQKKIPIVSCDQRKLDQMAGRNTVHQGVVAQVSAAEYMSLDDLVAMIAYDAEKRSACAENMDGYALALLDGVEDPHNLGAIIRSAEAAGIKAVLVPQRRSAGLTQTVAKTSAGALALMPVVRIGNVVQAIEVLKEKGFWVAGLDAEGTQTLFETDFARPIVIVIGGEGKGMARLVRENCDYLVRIPMKGKMESLNASAAAAVAFFEVLRQNLQR